MSTTTAIGSTTSTHSTTSTPTTALGQDSLNFNDFLQLMTSQLENQDPLNPTSDADYFAQIAQLGTVQGIDTLNNSSQVQQAQALMGQTVTVTNPTAATSGGSPTITGVVQNLSVQSGSYYLGIQSANGTITTVPISSLQNVQSTPNISNDSDLVGQTVTGPVTANGQTANATGTVTGVSLVNGIPTATVQISKTQTVTIPVSSLSSVSS
jgi:flagellar basal-body rod modification protein FlgD